MRVGLGLIRCPRCKSKFIRRSRPKSASEEWLPKIVLLRLVRCADCNFRFLRPLFFHVDPAA